MEKKIVKTSLPFSEDELDKYFDEIEKYYFIIDYKKSKYKGRTLLNYIYNSGMECDFCIEDLDKDVSSLLVEFVKHDCLVHVSVLEDLWSEVLLKFLSDDYHSSEDTVDAFTDTFIKEHEDVIKEVVEVIFAIQVHLTQVCSGLDGIIPGVDEKAQELTGNNIISLRHGMKFWETMALMSDKATAHNYSIFQDFRFDGKRLSAVFLSEFNPFTLMMAAINFNKKDEADNAKEDQD